MIDLRKMTASACLVLALASMAGCTGNVPSAETDPPAPPSTEAAASTAAPTSEPTEPPVTEVTYPYDFTSEDFFQIENYQNYMPMVSVSGVMEGKSIYQVKTGDGFSSMQGSCCDGEYAYFSLENKSYGGDSGYGRANVIVKVDMTTWEVVAQSEPLRMEHGNGMCYNPKLHQLIVVHYYNTPNMVSIVDPDTLELIGTKTLDMEVGSIAYNESRDQYVVGMVANSAPFAILDADFNQIAYYEGHHLGLGTQDVDCDDNYIYVGNSGGWQAVKVYDWDGAYRGVYQVPPLGELESMFNTDGTYYITFGSGNGGRVYKVDYDFSLIEK